MVHVAQIAEVVVARVAVDVVDFQTRRAWPKPAFSHQSVDHVPADFTFSIQKGVCPRGIVSGAGMARVEPDRDLLFALHVAHHTPVFSDLVQVFQGRYFAELKV